MRDSDDFLAHYCLSSWYCRAGDVCDNARFISNADQGDEDQDGRVCTELERVASWSSIFAIGNIHVVIALAPDRVCQYRDTSRDREMQWTTACGFPTSTSWIPTVTQYVIYLVLVIASAMISELAGDTPTSYFAFKHFE